MAWGGPDGVWCGPADRARGSAKDAHPMSHLPPGQGLIPTPTHAPGEQPLRSELPPFGLLHRSRPGKRQSKPVTSRTTAARLLDHQVRHGGHSPSSAAPPDAPATRPPTIPASAKAGHPMSTPTRSRYGATPATYSPPVEAHGGPPASPPPRPLPPTGWPLARPRWSPYAVLTGPRPWPVPILPTRIAGRQKCPATLASPGPIRCGDVSYAG